MTTTGVLALFRQIEIFIFLVRHAAGGLGDVSTDDKELNDRALLSGDGRLFSAYVIPKGKIWVITEADRSITTVLLPNEH